MPVFALLFMVLMLGSVALPGTSGFVGEFLTLLAAFEVNVILAIFAATGMVLGASYMLFLYRAVFFGPDREMDRDGDMDSDADMETNSDTPTIFRPLSYVEGVCLGIPAVLIIIIGIQPQFILDMTEPVSRQILIPFLDHGLILAGMGG